VDLAGEPYRAMIQTVDFDGESALQFNGYGALESGGTIVVKSGSETRTILLDGATGKATMP
jgi:hypothetical protein